MSQQAVDMKFSAKLLEADPAFMMRASMAQWATQGAAALVSLIAKQWANEGIVTEDWVRTEYMESVETLREAGVPEDLLNTEHDANLAMLSALGGWFNKNNAAIERHQNEL